MRCIDCFSPQVTDCYDIEVYSDNHILPRCIVDEKQSVALVVLPYFFLVLGISGLALFLIVGLPSYASRYWGHELQSIRRRNVGTYLISIFPSIILERFRVSVIFILCQSHGISS